MLNRRGFLASLLGVAAGVAIDPERALWVPGAKLISIPKLITPVRPLLSVGDVVTFAGRYAVNPLTRKVAIYLDPDTGKSYRFLQRFVVSSVMESQVDLWPKVGGLPPAEDGKRWEWGSSDVEEMPAVAPLVESDGMVLRAELSRREADRRYLGIRLPARL
jgi:hypothetical protein